MLNISDFTLVNVIFAVALVNVIFALQRAEKALEGKKMIVGGVGFWWSPVAIVFACRRSKKAWSGWKWKYEFRFATTFSLGRCASTALVVLGHSQRAGEAGAREKVAILNAPEKQAREKKRQIMAICDKVAELTEKAGVAEKKPRADCI